MSILRIIEFEFVIFDTIKITQIMWCQVDFKNNLLYIKCVTNLTVFFLLCSPVLGINRRLACLTSS